MFITIILYLLAVLAGAGYAVTQMVLGSLPTNYEPLRIGLMCCAIGSMGGALYCLRAIYLNKCVLNQWDSHWHTWYFLRPIVSAACGAVSFLFLKAGLLILESGTKPNASEVGFYALAFVAGLNVDKFITKIEDVAQAVWGIEKSRAAKGERRTEQ